MEGALRKAILKSEESPNEVLTAIRDVCIRLDNVHTRFELERDDDLIESCIYEMESLRARYRYLLRQAKKQGLTAAGLPPVGEEGERHK